MRAFSFFVLLFSLVFLIAEDLIGTQQQKALKLLILLGKSFGYLAK